MKKLILVIMVLFMSMALFSSCEYHKPDNILEAHPENVVTYHLYITENIYCEIDKYTYETEDQCIIMYKRRNSDIIQFMVTDKEPDTHETYRGDYFDF